MVEKSRQESDTAEVSAPPGNALTVIGQLKGHTDSVCSITSYIIFLQNVFNIFVNGQFDVYIIL